jgi:hypothetical protein
MTVERQGEQVDLELPACDHFSTMVSTFARCVAHGEREEEAESIKRQSQYLSESRQACVRGNTS